MNTNLVLLNSGCIGCDGKDMNLLYNAVITEPVANIIFDWIEQNARSLHAKAVIAIDQECHINSGCHHHHIINCNGTVRLGQDVLSNTGWFVISNGRYATSIDCHGLTNKLKCIEADIIAINAVASLQPYHEKARITSSNKVVGFRRFYDNGMASTLPPHDWPNYMFVRALSLQKILLDDSLSLNFSNFVKQCAVHKLNWRCLSVAAEVLDLATEDGLLEFITSRVNRFGNSKPDEAIISNVQSETNGTQISPSARIFGKVVIANNVQIGDGAVIVGPTILADSVKVAPAAVIRNSVIGSGISVPPSSCIQSCIYLKPDEQQGEISKRYDTALNCTKAAQRSFAAIDSSKENFRNWPAFSYARLVKRVADIIAAIIVLIANAPILAIVAVAIKLSSSGPVFFRHKRQGLRGKSFYCLKFRTMIVGADDMQEKLRSQNQVDGPQFKLESDPRTTVVGKFLRATYIDEIPQFINILFGQMSVVGPRPSPRVENVSCPFWRDARLSVRPGITGLWQICRTRREGHDFQEWIYYDTKYIKKMSLRMDLWICWQTARKLITSFIDQF